MSVSSGAEIERKYSVPEGAEQPSFDGVAEGATSDASPVAELDAVYLDTADRALLRGRIALRRRTGGHDAGWHVKLPAAVGRTELHAPIDPDDADTLPAELASALRFRLRGRALEPIARIRTERRAVVVRVGSGAVEVADDRVTAMDVAAGAVRSWREWEAEQVGDPEASAALLEQVDRLLRGAGATPSTSPAKLAQALGLVGRPDPEPARTAGGLLGAAVADRTERLHAALLALALGGDPDGTVVHGLRKTLRRIRALLALEPVAGAAGAALRDRLGSWNGPLGDARDPLVQADVAEEVLDGVDEDAPGLDAARELLVERPRAGLAEGTAAAVEVLGSAASLRALDALEAFTADGPDADADPAVLVRLADRVLRRAVKRARRGLHGDLDALHRGRKAAKRARFVVEEVVALGLLGRRSPLAKAGKRAKAVQDALGEHRDAALLAQRLPAASEQIAAAGGNAFALGLAAADARLLVLLLRRAARKRIARLR